MRTNLPLVFVVGSALAFGGFSALSVKAGPSAVLDSYAFEVIPKIQLAEGMHAESNVLIGEELTRANGTTVRPVAVTVNFMYRHGLVTRFSSLKLVAPTTSEPIRSALGGISPTGVDATLPDSVPSHNYEITIQPKPGRTWSEVRGCGDVSVSVVGA